MILTDKIGKVETDENDILMVLGSCGKIYFHQNEYEVSFYEGKFHYEIEDSLFSKKVELKKLENIDIKSQAIFEQERENQRNLL
ncbi:hypothetical protein [Dysgonomonas mossii]|uniref:Uncharacterized protein n=1 Tax=Dysgonomonas mossii DSM 22836 TaxID=742767 RepID=F8X535_9BACT|nr:hypothetical protein [Dysgonomonas mossii]EGK04733.1 hypothetical protein HMPREF9456_03344 [Dysgonomonas mossii DSM 22836]